MPRPGPRPYECVRRAWHSERHQPMRGSLIKEIFRIAHEIHSLPTKKNKEWQEKLPIVVLKAEEIMYSKANSEAEYMDPKTLMERVNEAIDTIIRRDESADAETGELLHPCIEAALHLGCIPRRASRSERNSNPRFYLGPYSLDKGDGIFKTASPLAPQHPNFFSSTVLNSKLPGKGPPKCDYHLLNGDMNILPVPASLGPASFSAYPLYYDGPYPPSESQPGFMALPVNTPKQFSSVSEKTILETRHMQNDSPLRDKDSSTTITEEDQPEEFPCDLSLRLAPLSVSAPWTNAAAPNMPGEPEDNVGPNFTSREAAKLNDFATEKQQRQLTLCPGLCLSSGMVESQAGITSIGSDKRKRQAAEAAEGLQPPLKTLCTFSQVLQRPLKHPNFSFL